MYWYFYLLLTTICFSPIIFWLLHIILFGISCITFHRPGRIFFLIPGAIFCIHDLRYEFFGGSIHHSIILVIIELILLIIGCIIVIAEDSILGAVISLIQGYIFGVIAIMVLTFISAGLFVSIIILIMMLIAACLMFS